MLARERSTVEGTAHEDEGLSGPRGIGGWLILPIIGLVLTCIFALTRLVTDYVPLLQSGYWPNLPISGRSLITFEVIADVVTTVGPLVLLPLLFLKRRILPRLMVGFYGFAFLTLLADSVGILAVGPELVPDAAVREELGWSVAGVTPDIARAFWASAIWIPYFLISTRVKRTFVNPRPPEDPAIGTGYQTAVPMVVGTVTPSAMQPAAFKKARGMQSWVVGGSLVALAGVLTVLVWNCAAPPGAAVTSPSSSASGDSSSASQFNTYTDPDYGYSIDYPAYWRLREDEGVDPDASDSPLTQVSALDPSGAHKGLTYFDLFDIVVFDYGVVVDESMLSGIRADLETFFAEQATAGVEMVEPLTEAVAGGLRGFSATFTDSLEGQTLKTTIFWLYGSSTTYFVTFQSADTTWDRNQATFEQMIASFRTGGTE